MKFKTPFGYLLLSGVFLFIDRLFKWQATHDWNYSIPVNRFFGWEPFLNVGIAFGIILPVYVVIVLTLIIISVVLFLFYRHFSLENRTLRLLQGVSLVLIFTGAVSNLFDRALYQNTIDYIRIFTSIINIADCLIVAGFVLYFWTLKQIKQQHVN